MASTTVSAPNYARRIKWLGFIVGIVVLAYAVLWYLLAHEVERRFDEQLATVNKGVNKIECADRQVRGFPFRFGFYCNKIAAAAGEKGAALDTGSLYGWAYVYYPWLINANVQAPLNLAVYGMPSLKAEWSDLRSSLSYNLTLPERVSIVFENLVLSVNNEGKQTVRALSATFAATHARTEGTDLSFAGEIDGAIIDPAMTPNRVIPEFSANYDIVLKNGVAIALTKPEDIKAALRGQSGELRTVSLIFKQGGAVKVSGPLKLSADGLLDGDIKLTFTQADKLSVALGQAIPEAAKIISNTLTAASVASGAGKEASLTLTVRSGKVSAGFFPVASIPAL